MSLIALLKSCKRTINLNLSNSSFRKWSHRLVTKIKLYRSFSENIPW